MTADPLFLAGEILPAGKLAALSPDPTPFTPTWTGVTLGTTGLLNVGVAWQIGREVNFALRLVLGTGGDVTATISVDLPVAADAAYTDYYVASVFGALNANSRYSGAGVFSSTQVSRLVNSATNIGWNASQPFDWVAGSDLRIQGRYIAAP